MRKRELINDKMFKSAPDGFVMAFQDFGGTSYLLGEPTCSFRKKIRFSHGLGITKGELLKSKAFHFASDDAELTALLPYGERSFVFAFVNVEFTEGYITIIEKYEEERLF